MFWKNTMAAVASVMVLSCAGALTAVAQPSQIAAASGHADKAAVNAAVSAVKRQPSHDLEKDFTGGPSDVPGDWSIYTATIQTIAQHKGKVLLQIQAMDRVMGRQLAEHQMGTVNAESTFLVVVDTTKKPPKVDPKRGVLKCGSSEPENEEIARIKSSNQF